MDPATLTTISVLSQAASALFNAKSMALQAETRQESMKASIEAARINQEHQLRMFYLQQEYQNQARWIDSKLRIEQQKIAQENQHILEAHKVRLSKSGERFYTPGTWIKTHLPNEPAPIVIIAENPESKNNPFKHETTSIAPLGRITERLKHYNEPYMGEGEALSIITTQEYFVSEADAKAFYNQELNCPTILIYAEFSGDSLKIKALIAGMLGEQIKFIVGEGGQLVHTLGPRIIDLWKIPYQSIQSLKSNSEHKSNKLEWLNTLETYTETMVGLYVQLLLDSYFKNVPPNVYQPQAARYLKDKESELRQIGLWETLEKSINSRIIAIKTYQNLLQKTTTKGSSTENRLLGTYISFSTAKVIEKVDGTWALKDEQQNIFKPYFINSELNPNPKFVGGVARIVSYNKEGNKKIGFIDDEGFLAIPFEYDDSDEASEGFVAVCKNGKWGLINLQGQVVLPFEYEDLNSPIDGLVSFKKVGKWGVVDVKGVVFFKNEFDKIEIVSTQYVILKQNNCSFVSNIYGDVILKQKNIGFIKHLKDGIFLITENYLTYIFIHKMNKTLQIGGFQIFESDIFFKSEIDNYIFKSTASDINGKFVVICLYNDRVEVYRFANSNSPFNRNLRGELIEKIVIDFSGTVKESGLLEPRRDFYEPQLDIDTFSQIGYVYKKFNNSGALMYGICTVGFDKILINTYERIQGFFDGLAAVKVNGKWGFINISNELIISFIYEDIRDFSDGLARVKLNGKWGIINQEGEKIVDFLFKEITPYQGNRAFVKFSDHSNKYWGIIDNQGNILAE